MESKVHNNPNFRGDDKVTLALQFLRGRKPDHTGVKVDQYFNMTEEELESCHGWVQWAFPIDTASPYNSHCGNLFRNSARIHKAFKYGTPLYVNRAGLVDLYLATVGIDLYAGTNMTKFFQVVDSPYNHHMKRLSRVMLHLMITGAKQDARWVFKSLMELVMRNPNAFTIETVAYWGAIMLEFDDQVRITP